MNTNDRNVSPFERNDWFRSRTDSTQGIASLLLTGRGWEEFDRPISLEPVLPASSQLHPPEAPVQTAVTDDGRYLSFFEKLFLGKKRSPEKDRTPHGILISPPQPGPQETESFPITELQVRLPRSAVVGPDLSERLLLSLANRTRPVALEIVGTASEILFQIVVNEPDAEQTERQVKAHFPESNISKTNNYLKNLFQQGNYRIPNNTHFLVIDFGLKQEVLRPFNALRSFEPDPLISLLSGLTNLRQAEKCVFQVLFQAAKEHWAERFIGALTGKDGKPCFAESKDLVGQAKQKFSRPILAVAIRLGIIASNRQRAIQIARGLAGTFQIIASPNSNELIALRNETIPTESQLSSLINRNSYRSGMLLNSSELATIVHLPSSSVTIEKLKRNEERTKKAPNIAFGNSFNLGENTHCDETETVSLSTAQFVRHMFICGGSGGGKSTLLANLALQTIEKGGGCCVVDSAGDLTLDVMGLVPDHRLKDVIIFDPSDSDYPVGFNPLEAQSEAEKYLLSSDLLALFRRYSTTWGSIMEAATAHAINAFLFNNRSGTLFDLKRFLIEKDFRHEILQTVEDETVRYFWEQESSGINAKSLSSVLIRLDAFLRHALIRNAVCQKQNKLDFRRIMDEGKILLIKISQGLIGQENASLLGTLVISKLYQIALSRQDTEFENRKPFWIFADEVQNYLSESMGQILSSTRKYGVGLTMATQSFRILQSHDAEVAESILANCYTRVCFRLGDEDAKRFSSGFSFFNAGDLQNLAVGQAIARIERTDFDFNLETFPFEKVQSETAEKRRNTIVENTRKTYAIPRIEVEAQIQCNSRIPTRKLSIKQPSNLESHANHEDLTKSAKTLSSNEPSIATQSLENSPEINKGRGGQHHQEIAAVIRRMAESYGFHVEIEKSVLDGSGSVDVSLEKQDLKIACEVSVTSTTDYETKNVLKCLAAAYDYVVVVLSNQKKINSLKTKLRSAVPIEQQDKVKVFSITELLGFLRELSAPEQKTHKKQEKPDGSRLSFAEACEFFDINSSTLYRWVREGRVPFYRPGREYQFDRDELVLIGRHDLSRKRKVSVKLSPLKIEKNVPKSKKEQDSRYRKLLNLD